MKFKIFVLPVIGAVFALALITSRPLVSAVPHLQATISAATGARTTQCGFIDALLANSIATPNATQSATQVGTKAAAQPAVTGTAVASAPTNTPTAAEGGAGEAGGGDESLTTYRDSKLKFAIAYPHSWSRDTTFKTGACFTGRDASIAVQFITDAVPTDLMAYVKAAEAKVQARSPGYRQVYLKPSSAIQGAVILGYEWDAGKSTVTEKPVHARTDRYYLIDSAGRFVVITETEPINQFDPDGVRDTVLTYQAMQ